MSFRPKKCSRGFICGEVGITGEGYQVRTVQSRKAKASNGVVEERSLHRDIFEPGMEDGRLSEWYPQGLKLSLNPCEIMYLDFHFPAVS